MTHDTLKTSRHELDTAWCVDDACEAHTILDAIDDSRRKEHDRVQRDSERP